MSPDRVSIASGQEIMLFSVRCLNTQTIHVGVPVHEVRLQPLQLRFYKLLFTEAVLMGLRHVFQRQSGRVKLLVNSVEEILVLGYLGCRSLEIAARILFRSSQARSYRFHLLLRDARFTSAQILNLFRRLFGF
uniref:Uncharacterized protein n=1 Tax=Peronospora matthiolae TaxID=2874970 RepID=A0AAV1V3K2_9STRA